MPARSQISQLMVPEAEKLRAERHRFIYFKQAPMSAAFAAFGRRARPLYDRSRPFAQLYVSLNPDKRRERAVLFYYLLTDPKSWDGSVERERATRIQRNGKERLFDDPVSRARNVRMANQYKIRLSGPGPASTSRNIDEHVDLFLVSLRPRARFQYLAPGNRNGWHSFFRGYRLWVANEVSIACSAMEDFIDHLVNVGDHDHFRAQYGGNMQLVAALMSNGAYSEEEVIAAIVAGAVRVGMTRNYRVDNAASENALRAWRAFKLTLSGAQYVRHRNRNALNLHDFARNLGL